MTSQWELRKQREGGSFHQVKIVQFGDTFQVHDASKSRNFFHQDRTREQTRLIAKRYLQDGYYFVA